ncbi:hypothetical protein [Marivirga lumbricoides]|uniref:hypothetical protein n=1 Tax=Marivirga lumbricoides TaxID=1046115 RepID=UPI001664F8C3
MYIPANVTTKLTRNILKKGFCFCLYLFSINVLAQNYSFQKIREETASGTKEFKPSVVIDSLQLIGFLSANFEISETDSSTIYTFYPNERYMWGGLSYRMNGVTEKRLFKELENGKYANRLLLKKKLNQYLKEQAHNKGYPFAEANLIIDSVIKKSVFATVDIDFKNQIVYDSIEVVSENEIVKVNYLQNFLNMPVGKLFNTSDYLNIPDKLKQLRFIKLTEPPLIEFSNGRSQITLFVEKIKNSQLDAFIGLVPEGESTYVTGQVDVSFQNLFRRAVNWQLNWQKYSASSQFLYTQLSQKSAFKTSLGINSQFGLLQEDSTFLQNSFELGVFYPVTESITLGVSYKGIFNNLIRDFDSTEVSQNNDPFRSSRINSAGFSVAYRQKETYPVLKNNLYFILNFDVGLKTLRNVENLPEEWSNVPVSSTNYTGMIELGSQQKLSKRFLLEEKLQMGIVENEALSHNDLLRLGGLQNLRGFDRNFFYTTYYAMLNLNYRYFLDNNSSFFLLTDLAQLDNSIGSVYAFGAGLDIKSKNGWFRLIYAIGSQIDEQINFSTAKVHFGYIAVF